MAKVNIVNVVVLDNPSPFHNPFQFEITFEALEDLSEGKKRVRKTVISTLGHFDTYGSVKSISGS